MKIGLFFGSFNPVHIGHIIIANHLVENSDLDQLWMVITPHNPHKKKKSLLDNYHRLHMVELATKSYEKIVPSTIEFNLPQPNYTVNTLAHLEEKFPKHTFSLIMGEDNLNSLHKWKNYEYIINHYDLYVYPRIAEGTPTEEIQQKATIHKIDAPIIEISSTYIRNAIKEGKSVRPLLDGEVLNYIEHNLFYKK